jgi:pimeloyl-ACP methyl ester carboxylesterase
VRAVVMKGIVPPDMIMPMNHARDGQRAFDLLVAGCAADRACRAAFPDIPGDLARALARLSSPDGAAVIGPTSKRTLRMTRGSFAEALRNLLYSPQSAADVPLAVHQAASGDFGAFADTALRLKAAFASGDLAAGMLLSVSCAEDIPFIDPGTIAAETQGTFLGDYRIVQQMQGCREWPSAKSPDDVHAAVKSDVPVLLISGERDPVTPPRWGEAAARQLGRARHVVAPYNGHPIGTLEPCAGRMMAQFLETASLEAVDASCVSDAPLPPFKR